MGGDGMGSEYFGFVLLRFLTRGKVNVTHDEAAYEVKLPRQSSILDLKRQMQAKTNIIVEQQMLIHKDTAVRACVGRVNLTPTPLQRTLTRLRLAQTELDNMLSLEALCDG